MPSAGQQAKQEVRLLQEFHGHGQHGQLLSPQHDQQQGALAGEPGKDDGGEEMGSGEDDDDNDDDYCMIRSSNGSEARKISKAMLQKVCALCCSRAFVQPVSKLACACVA
jgi:hypothetical protein